ncbi:MAG TPA: acyltransferase family protein [Xylella sp.]
MNPEERGGQVGTKKLVLTSGYLSVGRDPHIDATKGLGIVLVVLGHAKGLRYFWTVLIYSVHVPLFFLLSGWVSGIHVRQREFGERVLQLVRTLLVQYVFFFSFLE